MIPILTTTAITSITTKNARSGGNIIADGGTTITARGVCWNTSSNPTIENSKTSDGSGTGSFVSNLTVLTPSTNYYVRAYATNSVGTAYGNELSFSTTTVLLPSITTTAITSITSTNATSGGNITDDGGATITTRGVCWGTTSNPTITNNRTIDGSGTGSFTSLLTGLTANTTYFVRAYATNSVGISYGNQVNFTTSGVVDVDGNVYKTVIIGTQTWMKENLKTTKYRNGDAIPNVTDNTAWSNLSTGAYCYYNNTSSNGTIYGNLYNFYAVVDERNLCPTGWHVPTDTEWKTLEMYLGMTQATADLESWRGTDEGAKLKEQGNTHWGSPNSGTNSSGFTALGGGSRYDGGNFNNLAGEGAVGGEGGFLTASSFDAGNCWMRAIYGGAYSQVGRFKSNPKYWGRSLRCIKD